MHLDFAPTPDDLDLLYVCEQTEKFNYGGRVAIGHVTKLSAAPPELFDRCAKRMADAGVALTVLPSTDLYLMGRHKDHSVMRGVTPSHKLLHHGVNCSLSTNNVLNPFTPFGDCSLVRMANLYANICQVGAQRRHPRMLPHDLLALGQADEPEELRARARLLRRHRGARRRRAPRRRWPSSRRCCTSSSAGARRCRAPARSCTGRIERSIRCRAEAKREQLENQERKLPHAGAGRAPNASTSF